MNKKTLEMERWLAEHVMGWQWWRFHVKPKKGEGHPVKWCQLVPPNETWPVTRKGWHGRYCKRPIAGLADESDFSQFSPMTDLASATQVLLKCCEQYRMDIRTWAAPEGWWVVASATVGVMVQKKTWPEAVCECVRSVYKRKQAVASSLHRLVMQVKVRERKKKCRKAR